MAFHIYKTNILASRFVLPQLILFCVRFRVDVLVHRFRICFMTFIHRIIRCILICIDKILAYCESEQIVDKIGRKKKTANVFSLFQREKDEAIGELEATKDRMEMTQASHNRAVEEKDMINKELERLLEKYDR